MTNYHNTPEVFNNYFLTVNEILLKNKDQQTKTRYLQQP